MCFQRIYRKSGFTLLEVIAVLALISVFSVLAIIRHSATDASLTAQTQVLAAHIRYAQMRALNTDTQWGIYYFHAANSKDSYYLLYSGANTANIAQLPGESQDRIHIGDMGIIIESALEAGVPSAGSFELKFDSWGRPQSYLSGAWRTGSLALRLSKSGQAPQHLTITKNTGFIQ